MACSFPASRTKSSQTSKHGCPTGQGYLRCIKRTCRFAICPLPQPASLPVCRVVTPSVQFCRGVAWCRWHCVLLLSSTPTVDCSSRWFPGAAGLNRSSPCNTPSTCLSTQGIHRRRSGTWNPTKQKYAAHGQCSCAHRSMADILPALAAPVDWSLHNSAPHHQLPLQVLRYSPGQRYKPHMDAYSRMATVLIYLTGAPAQAAVPRCP